MKPQKEIISIHIGQSGTQIGDSVWELLNKEHNISSQGNKKSQNEEEFENINSFYHEEEKTGKFRPNAVFIDTDSFSIEKLKTGDLKDLYSKDSYAHYKTSSGKNFAVGKRIASSEFLNECLDRIRDIADNCENFQGFMINYALGGGTGSGFGSSLMEEIYSEYGKKSRLGVLVSPSKYEISPLESYNFVLGMNEILEKELFDIFTLVDNEACYKICKENLDINIPNYKRVNEILAMGISSITLPMRFNSSLNCSLDDLISNLVCYPRINGTVLSYSPITSKEKIYLHDMSVYSLTKMAFFKQNYFLTTTEPRPYFFSSCLFYRGDFSPLEVKDALAKCKNQSQIHYHDWTPNSFKVGINPRKPETSDNSVIGATNRSLALLGNSKVIAEVYVKNDHRFDLMFSKRAFVHSYVVEGLEENFLIEARENMAALEKDYEPGCTCCGHYGQEEEEEE